MRKIANAIAALLMVMTGCGPASARQSEAAVLAGGCYWGMDLIFRHVKGVEDVVSGFAGKGRADGPAEAVRIWFDPGQISYQQLLQIYFTVAHDPTEVDRQGPDVGPNYRSAIFPQNPEQRAIATQMIAKLQAAHVYPRPIATKIESGGFEAAPPDQQNFGQTHPTLPYIVINDLPKLARLKHDYPQWWKA